MTDRLAELSAAGVAVWLDDISRERLRTRQTCERLRRRQARRRRDHQPDHLRRRRSPQGDAYDEQLTDLALRGRPWTRRSRLITTYDVRWACDVLRPAYDAYRRRRRPGVDRGRPAAGPRHRPHRRRGQGAVVAGRPAQPVHQDPGHQAGPARRSPRRWPLGISVNVTLIFSLSRYDEVMDAFLAGMEQARANGHDLSRIGVGGVVLRVPGGHRDRQAAGQDRHARRPRRCAARPPSPTPGWPTQRYEKVFAGDRWQALAAAGASRSARCGRRPASRTRRTRDIMYVEELVAPGVVNTMPEATLHAVADHGEVRGDTVTTMYAQAQQVDGRLAALGIDYDDVVADPRARGRGEVRGLAAPSCCQAASPSSLEAAGERGRPDDRAVRRGRRRDGWRRPCWTLAARAEAEGAGGQAGRRGPDAVGAGRRGGGEDPARLGRHLPAQSGSCCRGWPRCGRSWRDGSTTSCWPAWAARRWRRR